MGNVSVDFEGLRELGEAMKNLSKEVNGKIARRATLAGASIVKKAAIKNAPVDTGNLKKNIIFKRTKEAGLTEQFIVTVRKGRVTQKQKDRGISDAFYAKFVEFGTVKTQANPFLRPAFDNNKQAASQSIVEALKTGIAKAIK